MPGVFRLKYRDGREEEFWGRDGYHYVMAPDRVVDLKPVPAWCHHCNAMTIAESPFRSPAEIEKELEENADPQSARHLRLFAGSPPEKLVSHQNALKTELEHAKIRKSPPHCMECGKTRVSYFVWNEWQPHPKTGEEVFFKCVGIGSTNMARRFFNPEGEELVLTEAERKRLLSLV